MIDQELRKVLFLVIAPGTALLSIFCGYVIGSHIGRQKAAVAREKLRKLEAKADRVIPNLKGDIERVQAEKRSINGKISKRDKKVSVVENKILKHRYERS